LILLLFTASFSRDNFTYSTDSAVVQEILDSNGLYFGKVAYCTSIDSSNRINRLALPGRSLSRLPSSIGRLTHLKYLDLNHNVLDSLPESVSNLTELDTLVLHTNHLQHLPDSFGNLPKLTYLNIQSCNLTSLPNSFIMLGQLMFLYLGFNSLSFLPDSFGKLEQLRELELRNNYLSVLPVTIINITRLQSLDICTNLLYSLPQETSNWANWFAPGWQTCQLPYKTETNLNNMARPILEVYPIPCNKSSEIRILTNRASVIKLNVYNVQGRRLFKTELLKSAQHVQRIPLRSFHLSQGIYILQAIVDDAIYSKKIVYTK